MENFTRQLSHTQRATDLDAHGGYDPMSWILLPRSVSSSSTVLFEYKRRYREPTAQTPRVARDFQNQIESTTIGRTQPLPLCRRTNQPINNSYANRICAFIAILVASSWRQKYVFAVTAQRSAQIKRFKETKKIASLHSDSSVVRRSSCAASPAVFVGFVSGAVAVVVTILSSGCSGCAAASPHAMLYK